MMKMEPLGKYPSSSLKRAGLDTSSYCFLGLLRFPSGISASIVAEAQYVNSTSCVSFNAAASMMTL